MKIVIAEGGSAENVGSMALIENAIKIARLRFPNAAINVLTPTVDSVQNALEKDNISGIKVIDDLFCKPPSKTSIFLKLLWLIQNVAWIALIRFVQFFKINPTHFSIGK